MLQRKTKKDKETYVLDRVSIKFILFFSFRENFNLIERDEGNGLHDRKPLALYIFWEGWGEAFTCQLHLKSPDSKHSINKSFVRTKFPHT